MPNPFHRNPLQSIPGFAGSNLGDQIGRDKIFEAMRGSINPIQVDEKVVPQVPDAAPVRINVGSIDKTLNGLEPINAVRNREVSPSPSDPNATRPRYAGVALPDDVLGKQAAMIEAEKQAPANSQIQTTENRVGWGAPKPHKGIWDRVGQIGKGAVISMGEYAKTHPGADTAELLSAGGAGGIVGGVSPVSIDALQRQAQIGRDEQQLGHQVGLQQEQAQLEGLKAKPALEAERIRVEEEARAREAQAKADEFAERQRHNRATENRPRSERPPLLRERTNADGSKTTLRSVDNGTTWEEVPDLTSAAKPIADNSELVGNLDKRIGEYSEKAKGLRSQADKLTEAAKTDYVAGEDRQRLMKEADEADQEAARLRGERDREATKPKLRAATPKTSVKPAKDGKYHYTLEQIRASAGDRFDEVYQKLKANPKVVIEE